MTEERFGEVDESSIKNLVSPNFLLWIGIEKGIKSISLEACANQIMPKILNEDKILKVYSCGFFLMYLIFISNAEDYAQPTHWKRWNCSLIINDTLGDTSPIFSMTTRCKQMTLEQWALPCYFSHFLKWHFLLQQLKKKYYSIFNQINYIFLINHQVWVTHFQVQYT